jgi:hypothetical protein
MTTTRVWKIVATVVAVPVLAMGVLQVPTALAHDERTVDEEVPAAGIDVLDVDSEAGPVRVVGVEGATTVSVHARISDGWRASGHEMRREGDRLLVRASCPNFGSDFCSVDYTIEVPRDLRVEVRAGERVEVSDLDGGVRAASDQARLVATRVGGDVTLRADQGSIEATDLDAARVDARSDQGSIRLEFAESPEDVTAEADQGSVDIVLPDDPDVTYIADFSADQGTVSGDTIRQDPDSDRTLSAHADQGSVTVVYARR